MSSVSLKRNYPWSEMLHFTVHKGIVIKAPTRKELMKKIECKYNEIKTVRAGYTVIVNPASKDTIENLDYELPEIDINDGIEEASSKIRRLLKKDIDGILKGVTAVMLSGGVDSIITAYLAKQLNPHVIAYTLTVKGHEAEDADLPYARKAAEELEIELIEVKVSENQVRECINDVVYAAEDMRDYNIYSAIGAYLIGKRISQDCHKKVACGEGPDEIFGSYEPWGSHAIDSKEAKKPKMRRKFVRRLEWNLSRGTKTLRYLGLKVVSPFLIKDFIEYAVNLPANIVNIYGHRKGILAKAFEDVISKELLLRPKTRFQDGSGITNVLRKAGIDNKYIESTYKEIFKVDA